MKTWKKSETFGDSLGHAMAGVVAAWRQEPNLRRQIVIGVLVLLTAWVLGLPDFQIWLLLFVATAVLVLEMMNSALEYLMDVLHPKYDSRLKVAKDMMAGAVLIMSVTAAVLGVLILGGPLIALVGALLN